jgi:hypothetical protein
MARGAKRASRHNPAKIINSNRKALSLIYFYLIPLRRNPRGFSPGMKACGGCDFCFGDESLDFSPGRFKGSKYIFAKTSTD